MKFKQYLIESTSNRSREISIEQFKKLLDTKCKKSKNIKNIFRGVAGVRYSYGYVEPSKFVRKSANTDNYYTLLLDNLSSWKKYPKRSKSIVCSTNEDYADAYGWPYIVYPFDGSKIGVCSSIDIWESFSPLNLLDFNNSLKYLYQENIGEVLDQNKWNTFKKQLLELEVYLKQHKLKQHKPGKHDGLLNMIGDWKKHGLLNRIEKFLDPNRNGFMLKTAGDNLPDNKEVWTNGNCLLERII